MKYENGEDIKVGDKIRIIMCSYPLPTIGLLGKVSIIERLIENVDCVYLERWKVNIMTFFIEKVDQDAVDIEMELNESTQFDPYKHWNK